MSQDEKKHFFFLVFVSSGILCCDGAELDYPELTPHACVTLEKQHTNMNASDGNKVKSLTQRQCIVEQNAQSTKAYRVRALLSHRLEIRSRP